MGILNEYQILLSRHPDSDGTYRSGSGEYPGYKSGGFLIETNAPIWSKFIKITFIASKDELISIKAKVVYCMEKEPKNFHIGIRFIETGKRIDEIMKEMTEAFNQSN